MNSRIFIRRFIVLLVLVGLLAGCGRDDSTGTPPSFGSGSTTRGERLQGRLLLWHSWTSSDEKALLEVLDNFREIHPRVSVKVVAVPQDELLENFTTAASGGLGPDLLIGPDDWLVDLSSQGLVADISAQVSPLLEQENDRADFLKSAQENLSYGKHLFGLPISLNTLALYYNRNLVETPAGSTKQLLEELNFGSSIAMSSAFTDLLWGIQAFGGRLMNDEGQIILDQGGFANWLDWLQRASSAPGMILDSNRADLQTRFMAGDVTYYVGRPQEYHSIAEALGDETVGVAPLPEGPLDKAAPLAGFDVFYFNPSSSRNQRKLSLELAFFATNPKQQEVLMRQARRVPANAVVRPNPRFDSVVFSFFEQSRNMMSLYATIALSQQAQNASKAEQPEPAQTLSLSAGLPLLVAHGDEILSSVLADEVAPTDAAYDLTQRFNQTLGLEAANIELPECKKLGQIELHYPNQPELLSALTELRERYRQICPFVIVKLVPINSPFFQKTFDPFNEIMPKQPIPGDVVLNEIYSDQIERADLFIAPHTLMPHLVDQALIAPISSGIDRDLLQSALTVSYEEALQYENQFYGLPFSLNLAALYYNRSQVESPEQLLDLIVTQETTKGEIPVKLGIHTQFLEAFWGATAFGAQPLFRDDTASDTLLALSGYASESVPAIESGEDAETYPLLIWLQWLKAHVQDGTVVTDTDKSELYRRFICGELTYLVAEFDLMREHQQFLVKDITENPDGGEHSRAAKQALTTCQDSQPIEIDALRAAPLPSGPKGNAQTFLTVNALFVNANQEKLTRDIAVDLASYLTSLEAQTLLLDIAFQLPTNGEVDIGERPVVSTFLEQSREAQLMPPLAKQIVFQRFGNKIYHELLQSDELLPEIIRRSLLPMTEAGASPSDRAGGN